MAQFFGYSAKVTFSHFFSRFSRSEPQVLDSEFKPTRDLIVETKIKPVEINTSTENSQPKNITLAFNIVALGNYGQLAKELILSFEKFFCFSRSDVQYHLHVHTDDIRFTRWLRENFPQTTTSHLAIRKGWPADSLTRLRMYLDRKEHWKNADYVFSMDADTAFVSPVCAEFISPRLGTHVSWYYQLPRIEKPFEINPKSTAFVSSHEGKGYYSGALFGGTQEEFLNMCYEISKNIDLDTKAGITAKWHDEGHLNRYFVDHPPITSLSPYYLYPDPPYDFWLVKSYPHTWLTNDLKRNGELKIVHLPKDHSLRDMNSRITPEKLEADRKSVV